MKHSHPLDGWTLAHRGGAVPEDGPDPDVLVAGFAAAVPGCAHTDLLAAGLIPDPYVDDNEAALAWIGRGTWEYRTTFESDELRSAAVGERLDLVVSGLDTFAELSLNGATIATTQNQFRTYRIDIADAVVPGCNDLVVTFDSALDRIEEIAEREGVLPHVYDTHPFNEVRKMACNFGWDWGPDLVTAGIGAPVRVERWSGARISSVRPLATWEAQPEGGSRGIVRVHVELETDSACGPVEVTATVDTHSVTVTLDPDPDPDPDPDADADADDAVPGASSGRSTVRRAAVVEVTVPDAALWWPRGYGDQPLYDCTVVVEAQGDLLDRWATRIGFRTVELDTTPDVDGIPFHLVVNGTRILVRGVNWIPDDAFPTRLDRARYTQRIDQAADAGVNLLRVWGGGLYETDDFYELADTRGLLVWQDFLFTCAAYRETDPLWSEVEAEAREAVTRLSSHASLVLWCGGNETHAAVAEWYGWRERLHGRAWGDGYYNGMLPAVVAELDPTRPYVPSSPYSFGSYASPNEQALGDVHIWDVWNDKDYTAYRDWQPRFASEWGYQAPAAWSTLTRAVHDEPLRLDGPSMLVHQKGLDGQAKLVQGLRPHLPVPTDVVDWHWATQLNQARAIRVGVEHFRSIAPRCTGTVLWQLNDCWPAISWSVIDGDGICKPAWYALRDAHADRLLTFRPGDDLLVAAVNDTDLRWSGDVVVRRVSRAGQVLGEVTVPIDVGVRTAGAFVVPRDLLRDAAPDDLVLASADGAARAWWYLREDVNGGLPAPDLSATVVAVDGGYRVDVVAHGFVKDLAVLPDRLDPAATPDRMLLTLLPGESASIKVSTQVEVDVEALTRYPVLRTANDLFTARETIADEPVDAPQAATASSPVTRVVG